MKKTFNIGNVKLEMRTNGFPKGFKLKRKLTVRECRHIMYDLLGIDIQTRDCYEFDYDYKDYINGMCKDVNGWLEGDCDDEVIAEYAYDCSNDQLGLINMIPITQYLIKKGVI